MSLMRKGKMNVAIAVGQMHFCVLCSVAPAVCKQALSLISLSHTHTHTTVIQRQ